MLLGIVGCLLLGVCYRFQKQPWQFSMAITCGVIAYHMLIRFLSPVILQFIFHRQYDCRTCPVSYFESEKMEGKGDDLRSEGVFAGNALHGRNR